MDSQVRIVQKGDLYLYFRAIKGIRAIQYVLFNFQFRSELGVPEKKKKKKNIQKSQLTASMRRVTNDT